MIGALVLAWFKKKKRTRETLHRWEREEAEIEASRQRVLDSLELEDGPKVASLSVLRLPKVQHEGDWHTLH